MARLFNGTNNSIECVAPVTAVPLTICGWLNPSAAVTSVPVSISTHSGASSRFQLILVAGASPMAFQATAVDNSAVATGSEVTFTGALGTWYHFAAVFASSSSRTAYINGIPGAESTTTIITAAPTRLNISGRYFSSTLGAFFNGRLAEVACYNAALSAAEIASLAKGFPARLIRPSALQFYSRLIRNVMDIRNAATLSELGAATTVSEHPRIIYPC